MGSMTFLGLSEKVMRELDRPLSPSEIWATAVTLGYDREIKSNGKTPAATLYSAIFSDARDNPETKFIKIGQRPARYFLKEKVAADSSISTILNTAEDSAATVFDYKEADLHPFLAYYCSVYFRASAKTIRHNTSTKKEFGEWVHPDMIGVYFAIEDWGTEVLDLSAALGNAPITFYSFEIKKTLSFSNLRESFFQAVSNSSWAHEGYLAAAEVSTDEDFLLEVRRLSAAFGIGILSLSLDDPDASRVISPARKRDGVDWETVNKMTMNKDVTELLKRIKNDIQTKEIIREKYDKIRKPQELIDSIKKK